MERGAVDADGLVGVQRRVIVDVGIVRSGRRIHQISQVRIAADHQRSVRSQHLRDGIAQGGQQRGEGYLPVIIHGQGSRGQHQPYAVNGFPVGGKQVQHCLVTQVDRRGSGGKREAVRVNDARSRVAARRQAAAVQLQGDCLPSHVQGTADPRQAREILHDDGLHQAAGQAAQADGVQRTLRSGGSGYLHIPRGFVPGIQQIALRDQDDVGRILGSQVQSAVVDDHSAGSQGIGVRQGHGARAGKCR